ncbi:MAG: hypothetical protein H6Q90_7145 [Deltaproteobacteria bacterium]|nr:hypothetical protein [Deltaproteobacteria bacterium]
MRSNASALLMSSVLLANGCGDRDISLAPGPPATFRLARVHDGWNIGIDLELRVPLGYEDDTMPFSRAWFRGNDPWIAVTTDPREQATFELPCGQPRDASGLTWDIAQRIEHPDDLTVVCEKRDQGKVRGVWIVRLTRNIDTVVQCSVTRIGASPSSKLRAEALSICTSMRVLGRSEWTDEDWLPSKR